MMVSLLLSPDKLLAVVSCCQLCGQPSATVALAAVNPKHSAVIIFFIFSIQAYFIPVLWAHTASAFLPEKKKKIQDQNEKQTPDANKEPGNVNKGKGVVYLTEKLEVCTLSPAALHLTAPSC